MSRFSPSSCSRRFKIVGNYLYAPVESTASFDSAEVARAENRKWTKEAEEKGMRWKGRVVPVENATITSPLSPLPSHL